MKALQMSLAKDLRAIKKNQKHAEIEREKSKKLYADALLLFAEYPHIGQVKVAMWAIAKVGVAKCHEIAAANLTGYHFRKKVAAL